MSFEDGGYGREHGLLRLLGAAPAQGAGSVAGCPRAADPVLAGHDQEDRGRRAPSFAGNGRAVSGLLGTECRRSARSSWQRRAGARPVDTLALDEIPASLPAPLDRLPTPGTPFVGRQAETTALALLLASPAVRLITIVGPGGMGKTRLALAVARTQQVQQPRAFDDGIFFVDLAPVLARDFIVLAIAAPLGLDLAPRRGDMRSPTQQLLDFLRPRQLLLVLDNLEHLLNDGVADLILAILPRRTGNKNPGDFAPAAQPARGTALHAGGPPLSGGNDGGAQRPRRGIRGRGTPAHGSAPPPARFRLTS